MENSATTIENLIERIEQYSKISFDLYKYSAIYETAALFSSLAVKLVMTLVVAVVALLFTVGLALCLGDALGKTAYGFLLMGGVYILLGIVLYIFRKPWIQTQVSNFVIDSFEIKN
ncbi:hypothetical protein [Flavobacterium sp.]|uniref:hypothetical protein n=1 Tax=Flavobacterium sp. TaxID=239 RepID=UPI002FD9B9B3